jgi:hypothetical protein
VGTSGALVTWATAGLARPQTTANKAKRFTKTSKSSVSAGEIAWKSGFELLGAARQLRAGKAQASASFMSFARELEGNRKDCPTYPLLPLAAFPVNEMFAVCSELTAVQSTA